ncbi:MAG: carboxypeptidase regulatory-like domain-containing protein, partial [Planctomycetia bacterium]
AALLGALQFIPAAPAVVAPALAADEPAPPGLTLLVVDEATKKPIAGAVVRVWTTIPDVTLGRRMRESDDAEAYAASTDAAGRLVIPPPRHSRWLTVDVAAPGYVMLRLKKPLAVVGDRRESYRLTAALKPGRKIGGRVVDGEGRPVVGATVLTTARMDRPAETAEFRELMDEAPAITDADGRWSSAVLPKVFDFLVVIVAHVDHKITDAHTNDKPFTISELQMENAVLRLGSSKSSAVRVVDVEGRPVAGAKFRDGFMNGMLNHLDKTTDAAGRITLRFGNAYTQSAVAVADGYAPTVFVLDESSDLNPATVVVKRGRTVGGVVRNDQGDPLQDARVFLTEFAGPEMARRSAFTDADGRFSLENCPLEVFSLSVDAPGYAPQSRTVGLDRNAASVVLYPELTQKIVVAVVDAATKKPIDATVEMGGILGTERPDFDKPKTVPAGELTFEFTLRHPHNPFNNRHVLRVTADGYKPFVTEAFSTDGRSRRFDVALEKENRKAPSL